MKDAISQTCIRQHVSRKTGLGVKFYKSDQLRSTAADSGQSPTPCLRCRANMACIRQSRLDPGLGFYVKAFELSWGLQVWETATFVACSPRQRDVGDASGLAGHQRLTTSAEDAQGTPTQTHASPSILVYEEKGESPKSGSHVRQILHR